MDNQKVNYLEEVVASIALLAAILAIFFIGFYSEKSYVEKDCKSKGVHETNKYKLTCEVKKE